LSTVLGGNASLASWPDRPRAGLLCEFTKIHVGVCTTDDGGSTGELVRRLPMIGIGDMRKVMLSMIDRDALAARYGPEAPVLKMVQQVFVHRFGPCAPRRGELRDPVRVLPPALRAACPPALRAALAGLTAQMDPALEARLCVPGHCLGNLLLTAAVFRGSRGLSRAPAAAAVEAGLRTVADAIGVPPGRVLAATATPGTLIYEYANGVVATGQSRASRARRGCAVKRVRISFAGAPRANPRLLAHLRRADLIVYAPGSLYSSMLPILLTPGVVEAIRANRRAVKILGANLWIQEGETDMSFREQSRGFWVSELIEAYGRNVPGGTAGLFDVALATSLDTVPGSIIRNYALEGKHPIHLDRARVAALGVMPVEASLFSNDRWQRDSMIHHDPARFAAAIRTVMEGLAREAARRPARATRRNSSSELPGPRVLSGPSACARMEALRAILAGKAIRPASLRPALEGFLWRHPDVVPAHLAHIGGVRIVPDAGWRRSREWDNVLGYFDPDSRQIMLHEHGAENVPVFGCEFCGGAGRVAARPLHRPQGLARDSVGRVPHLRGRAAPACAARHLPVRRGIEGLSQGRADGPPAGRAPGVLAAGLQGDGVSAQRHPVRAGVRLDARQRLRARARLRDADDPMAGLAPAALPGADPRPAPRIGPLLPRSGLPQRLNAPRRGSFPRCGKRFPRTGA
jgi:uncharacterized cofD-like protein